MNNILVLNKNIRLLMDIIGNGMIREKRSKATDDLQRLSPVSLFPFLEMFWEPVQCDVSDGLTDSWLRARGPAIGDECLLFTQRNFLHEAYAAVMRGRHSQSLTELKAYAGPFLGVFTIRKSDAVITINHHYSNGQNHMTASLWQGSGKWLR